MHMLQCYIHVYAYINMNIEQIPSKSFRKDYHSQKGNERERASCSKQGCRTQPSYWWKNGLIGSIRNIR